MRYLTFIAAVLAFGLINPSDAHELPARETLSALAPERLVLGAIRESDVALLGDYLRAVIAAAAQGREPPPPPAALGERARELGAELHARGALFALLLLAALEEQAKAWVRPAPAPPQRGLPPTVPYTPVSSR